MKHDSSPPSSSCCGALPAAPVRVAASRRSTGRPIAVSLEPASHLLRGETTLTVTPLEHGRHLSPSILLRLSPRFGWRRRWCRFGFPAEWCGWSFPGEFPERALRIMIRYRVGLQRPRAGADSQYRGPHLRGECGHLPRGNLPGERRGVVSPAPGVAGETDTGSNHTGRDRGGNGGKRLERRSTRDRNISVWEELHPVDHLSLSAGRYA